MTPRAAGRTPRAVRRADPRHELGRRRGRALASGARSRLISAPIAMAAARPGSRRSPGCVRTVAATSPAAPRRRPPVGRASGRRPAGLTAGRALRGRGGRPSRVRRIAVTGRGPVARRRRRERRRPAARAAARRWPRIPATRRATSSRSAARLASDARDGARGGRRRAARGGARLRLAAPGCSTRRRRRPTRASSPRQGRAPSPVPRGERRGGRRRGGRGSGPRVARGDQRPQHPRPRGARFLDSGRAELKAAVPRIERLAAEAETARKRRRGPRPAARRRASRSPRARRRARTRAQEAAAPSPAEEPHPFDALWPGESDATRAPAPCGADRRRRSSAPSRSGSCAATGWRGTAWWRSSPAPTPRPGAGTGRCRGWWTRSSPGDRGGASTSRTTTRSGACSRRSRGATSSARCRRSATASTGSAGSRTGGPGQRDLSLAVGYAGLDPMRIRTWPREAEMAELYARRGRRRRRVLAATAGDLTLGRMVDAARRARADDLAELWNAWGRIRPLLLATG